MDLYSAGKSKELFVYTTTRMTFKGTMLSEKCQPKNVIYPVTTFI